MQKLIEEFANKYQNQEQLKKIQYQLGVDQAGRGPVFGPMMYAALWWPKQISSELAKLGFADSKKLPQKQRQRLYQIIERLNKKLLSFQVKQLTAEYISNCSLGQPARNLNQISHDSALYLIKYALNEGFNVTNIYLDTVGDANRYREYLWNNLQKYPSIKEIVVTPKADDLYPVVSAASICAKVNRDRVIHNWKFIQNIQFKGELGSGYPSDPTTKEWLRNNKHQVFGYPNLIRFSWNTTKTALQDNIILSIKSHDEFQQLKGFSWFLRNRSKQIEEDLWNIISQ